MRSSAVSSLNLKSVVPDSLHGFFSFAVRGYNLQAFENTQKAIEVGANKIVPVRAFRRAMRGALCLDERGCLTDKFSQTTPSSMMMKADSDFLRIVAALENKLPDSIQKIHWDELTLDDRRVLRVSDNTGRGVIVPSRPEFRLTSQGNLYRILSHLVNPTDMFNASCRTFDGDAAVSIAASMARLTDYSNGNENFKKLHIPDLDVSGLIAKEEFDL